MINLINNVTGIFNSEGAAVSQETDIAASVVVTAVIAYGIYNGLSSQHRASIIMSDGPRSFKYISSKDELLLEYQGGTPEEVCDEFKQAMEGAIKAFFLNNQQVCQDQQLPAPSLTRKGSCLEFSSAKFSGCKITQRADIDRQIYKLNISINEELESEIWDLIQRNCLWWQAKFSVTRNFF